MFQIYMELLLMFTLVPVPGIGTFFFLLLVNIPAGGIVIPVPFSILFGVHAWMIGRKMPGYVKGN